MRQIGEGDGYADLRQAVSICVLNRVLFRQQTRFHHSFRLRCDQTELVLTDDFEFHTLELPKFKPSSDNIDSLTAEEKWLYLLQHAETMEADQLSSILAEPPYREALGVLEMISKNPEDLQFYEARLKYLRDEEAKLEAAMQEGMEKGMEKGLLAGKVQTLQELLGEPTSSNDELLRRPLDELSTLVQQLQSRLRRRDA